MKRTPALAVAGIALLLAAAALPVVGLVTADWDTDYVYEVQRSGYCADVASPTPQPGQGDDFVHRYETLSDAGQRHVQRALANGSHVVADEGATAQEFQFTDDHVAAGEGCYAIAYEGAYYALRTSAEHTRTGPLTGETASLAGWTLVALGAVALLGAGGSYLRAGRK